VEDKVVAGDSQHGFTRGKCCLTNLMAFCDGIAALVDEERLVKSSTRTGAKHQTLSCTTSISLNWRDMNLMDGPFGG